MSKSDGTFKPKISPPASAPEPELEETAEVKVDEPALEQKARQEQVVREAAAEAQLKERAKPALLVPPKPEGPKPAQLTVTPVEIDETTTVTPRMNKSAVRIGNVHFSFKKGVAQIVPCEIVSHLKEKGVL